MIHAAGAEPAGRYPESPFIPDEGAWPNHFKAMPILKVADAGGRFDGSPFPASATIAGVVAGVDTPASSLDNVTPTLTYYDGSGIAGTSLGPTPSSAPGTYTVVAAFPSNVDYSAILSTPLSITIRRGVRSSAWPRRAARPSTDKPSVSWQRWGRRRHAGRHLHIRRRRHSAGHGPAGWVRHGDVHHLGLSLGSHSITATYSGDADFLGVQSVPYSETVA